MDKIWGNDKSYPAGYVHIEAHVRNAQDKIRQLDEQIKNVPHDRPELTLTPLGFPKLRQLGNHDRQVSFLRRLQEDIRKETYGEVEKALADIDPQSAQNVRDRVLQDLYTDPSEHVVPGQPQQDKDQQWNIDKSQDLMVQFFDRTEHKEPVVEPSAETNQWPQSMSDRFMQSLHYNKGYDKADIEPDKTPEPDIELDKD
ncbi:hypothetical protein M0L20_07910 [Spirosoma sp. RP8]|uniref:Uncharacterized protein n=1 Tax=Spirosoma liriopis TaxID=2937440 RepID=A0ABT0HHX9_9BACT|nr:hypothetical protein [Spirosoma liriopis]MCK8491774.1 hypothetical protein [Spirosoma liriopis]